MLATAFRLCQWHYATHVIARQRSYTRKTMHNVEEGTSWETTIARRARRIAKGRRKRRRIRRLDVLVASALLLLLLLGWVKDFVKVEMWSGSHLLTSTPWNHAWSLR
jgi:hypothetical protein